MKKLLSILVTLTLIIGLAGTAFAAPAAKPVTKTGQVKYYTAKSITLGIAGKNQAFLIDAKTKILLNGAAATFEDAANKGVFAKITAVGNKLTSIDFGSIGDQGQGQMGLKATYTRTMLTDTNTPAPGNTATTTSTKKEAGQEESTEYAFLDAKTVDLGSVVIVPGTLKVVLNGKEIKVIDKKVDFDKTVVGDEAQSYIDVEDEDNTVLTFEAPITDKEGATQEDAEKVLSITYKKQMFTLTTTEVIGYGIDENVYSELNGKEVPLAVALNRSNYTYVVLSPKATIIYLNSFYKDMDCTVASISGSNLTIAVDVKGKTPFKDTLKITDITNVQGEDGSMIKLSQLKAGDAIKVTVDPESNYSVISVVKQKIAK